MNTVNKVTREVIAAGIAVHRELGPGLLESAYQACLTYELAQRGLSVETQKPLPIVYRGVTLDVGYRLDLVVEGAVIVELKSVEKLERVHESQMLSYLRLSGLQVGLLINFNVPKLAEGIRRFVNRYEEPTPEISSSARSARSAVDLSRDVDQ